MRKSTNGSGCLRSRSIGCSATLAIISMFYPVIAPASGVVHPDLECAALVVAAEGACGSVVVDHRPDGPLYPVYVVVETPGERSDLGRREVNRLRVDTVLRSLPPALALRVERRYHLVPAFSARLAAGEIAPMAGMPGVELVEPWRNYRPVWSESHALTRIDLLQSAGLTGHGSVIAFIDTGIDPLHPALGGAPFGENTKVIGGTDIGSGDEDPSVDGSCAIHAHGTSVAAFAAAQEVIVDGVPIRGAAPDASVVMVKITGEPGGTGCAAYTHADMVAAVEWIVDHRAELGIDVLSISVGTGTSSGGTCFPDAQTCAEAMPTVAQAFANAVGDGLIVFAAAGNSGHLSKDMVAAPACLDSLISVGMVYDDAYDAQTSPCDTVGEDIARADDVPCASASAELLEVHAPGLFITTGATALVGGAQVMHCGVGTSFASPLAAGATALLIEEAGHGHLDQDLVRQLFVSTGSPVTDFNADPPRTRARIDAQAALDLLRFDADQDGVINVGDNCLYRSNPDQTDADGDGFGNACDADLNQDLMVNFGDVAAMKQAFMSQPGDGNWNPAADLNVDLMINYADLAQMKRDFMTAPGPSGPGR